MVLFPNYKQENVQNYEFVYFAALLVMFVLLHRLSQVESLRWFPEASFQMLAGLIVTLLILAITGFRIGFDADLFFLLLLPPIMFNSGLDINIKYFYQNFMTIMVFANIGTVINALVVGGLCYKFGVDGFSERISRNEAYSFGSLISATDPVTTIAVFDSLRVEPHLYTIVVGVSILDDAVAVILFDIFAKFQSGQTGSSVILEAIGHFLAKLFLSMILGYLFGILFTYYLKHTPQLVQRVPLFLASTVTFVYCSYLIGESSTLSGIITTMFAAIALRKYYERWSPESFAILKHGVNGWSYVFESMVFFFIGLTLVRRRPEGKRDYQFIGWSLFACFVGRVVQIYPLAFLLNWYNRRPIPGAKRRPSSTSNNYLPKEEEEHHQQRRRQMHSDVESAVNEGDVELSMATSTTTTMDKKNTLSSSVERKEGGSSSSSLHIHPIDISTSHSGKGIFPGLFGSASTSDNKMMTDISTHSQHDTTMSSTTSKHRGGILTYPHHTKHTTTITSLSHSYHSSSSHGGYSIQYIQEDHLHTPPPTTTNNNTNNNSNNSNNNTAYSASSSNNKRPAGAADHLETSTTSITTTIDPTTCWVPPPRYFRTTYRHIMRRRGVVLSWGYQNMILFAGLRGPIAYATARLISSDSVHRSMFIAATNFTVALTTFVLGALTVPALHWFDIKYGDAVAEWERQQEAELEAMEGLMRNEDSDSEEDEEDYDGMEEEVEGRVGYRHKYNNYDDDVVDAEEANHRRLEMAANASSSSSSSASFFSATASSVEDAYPHTHRTKVLVNGRGEGGGNGKGDQEEVVVEKEKRVMEQPSQPHAFASTHQRPSPSVKSASSSSSSFASSNLRASTCTWQTCLNSLRAFLSLWHWGMSIDEFLHMARHYEYELITRHFKPEVSVKATSHSAANHRTNMVVVTNSPPSPLPPITTSTLPVDGSSIANDNNINNNNNNNQMV